MQVYYSIVVPKQAHFNSFINNLSVMQGFAPYPAVVIGSFWEFRSHCLGTVDGVYFFANCHIGKKSYIRKELN